MAALMLPWLVLAGAHRGAAEVRCIFDEDDVTAFTGQFRVSPHGLAKTARGTYVFFDASNDGEHEDSILEYDPGRRGFTNIASEALLSSATPGEKLSSIGCRDLEVDAADNVYAVIVGTPAEGEQRVCFVVRVPYLDGRYRPPELVVDLPNARRCGYELEMDEAGGRLVILIDTYRSEDDRTVNGLYTFDLRGASPGGREDLVKLAGFAKLGAAATPPVKVGEEAMGGTGLAVEGQFAYWHLTGGPAGGHGADGDLLRIELRSGEASVCLDRDDIMRDIGPSGVGQDGNFYFTTMGIDGRDLFMLVGVGASGRRQDVYQYDIGADGPALKGRAASMADMLASGHSLGAPIIAYSAECEVRDGRFYILTGSNLKENLLEIGPVPEEEPPPTTLRVAVYHGKGAGAAVVPGLGKRPDVRVEAVSPADIRDGVLADFDVLVQPGGSGSGQAAGLGESGREAVRRFVREGGGYIGICAGAYLATNGYSWSLGIVDARAIDTQHWARSNGTVQIELTDEGRRILDDFAGPIDIRYGQGPILARGGDPDLPDYTILAVYRSEVGRNGSLEGVMTGSPAILMGEYGRGRVFAISPHPEKVEGLRYLVYRMARQATR
ncbi:MAG: BPL-N domain-containing protein [Armatimonadota bacterium]